MTEICQASLLCETGGGKEGGNCLNGFSHKNCCSGNAEWQQQAQGGGGWVEKKERILERSNLQIRKKIEREKSTFFKASFSTKYDLLASLFSHTSLSQMRAKDLQQKKAEVKVGGDEEGRREKKFLLAFLLLHFLRLSIPSSSSSSSSFSSSPSFSTSSSPPLLLLSLFLHHLLLHHLLHHLHHHHHLLRGPVSHPNRAVKCKVERDREREKNGASCWGRFATNKSVSLQNFFPGNKERDF